MTWTLLLIASTGTVGCGTFGVINPDARLPEGEESPGFVDRMSSQADVSENDALRGMLMLVEGGDPCQTFGNRVERLKGKEIVGADWNFNADRPLTKGRLAYMVYQACSIPGGVILRLLGPNPRYCRKELQYRGLMGPGTSYNTVTGMEYVAVLSRADTYRRTGKVPKIMKATGGGK